VRWLGIFGKPFHSWRATTLPPWPLRPADAHQNGLLMFLGKSRISTRFLSIMHLL
jgi:hypothetical protein